MNNSNLDFQGSNTSDHMVAREPKLSLSQLLTIDTPFGGGSDSCPHDESPNPLTVTVVTNGGDLDSVVIALDGDATRSLLLILVTDSDGAEFRMGVSREQAAYLIANTLNNKDLKVSVIVSGYNKKDTGDRVKTVSLFGKYARLATKGGKEILFPSTEVKEDVKEDDTVKNVDQG